MEDIANDVGDIARVDIYKQDVVPGDKKDTGMQAGRPSTMEAAGPQELTGSNQDKDDDDAASNDGSCPGTRSEMKPGAPSNDVATAEVSPAKPRRNELAFDVESLSAESIEEIARIMAKDKLDGVKIDGTMRHVREVRLHYGNITLEIAAENGEQKEQDTSLTFIGGD